MRIAVACGGTGGHVFPGLVTANVLVERGNDVTLWLAGRDVEGASLDGWEGRTVFVESGGFSDSPSLREALGFLRMTVAVVRARAAMGKSRPDVLLAMGSYASVGPVLAARSLGVPYVLHEANAIPGRAVSWLERSAGAVALAFESASEHLRNERVVVTGFPVRRDLAGRFDSGELEPGLFTVMVTGGSQGALQLDEISSQAICLLRERGIEVQVIHLARPENRDWVARRYREGGVPGPVFGFLKEMGKAYNSSDLAVARAGAATCAELCACGLPALLVPLPSARRNHQMLNAMAMKNAGMADVVDQSHFNRAWLSEYLAGLCRDRTKLDVMKKAMQALAASDAAEKLADLVEKVGSVDDYVDDYG